MDERLHRKVNLIANISTSIHSTIKWKGVNRDSNKPFQVFDHLETMSQQIIDNAGALKSKKRKSDEDTNDVIGR